MAVESIDLAVQPGEFVSIVGPSSCGKSTFLYIVGGFAKASGGVIICDERRMTTKVQPPAGTPLTPATAVAPDGAFTTPGTSRVPRALSITGSTVLWLAVRLYPLVLPVVVWHVLGVRRVLDNEFAMPRPRQVLEQAVVLGRTARGRRPPHSP